VIEAAKALKPSNHHKERPKLRKIVAIDTAEELLAMSK